MAAGKVQATPVKPALDKLLASPHLWLAGKACATSGATVPTSFPSLDRHLPGGGWPLVGMVELLLGGPTVREFTLVLPALASLQARRAASWAVLVSPPDIPYAPALAANGINLERLLVLEAGDGTWAMEQVMRSGICCMAIGWLQVERAISFTILRRLQLAAIQAGCLCVLVRSSCAAREPSPAMLRLELQLAVDGLMVRILKARGGSSGLWVPVQETSGA